MIIQTNTWICWLCEEITTQTARVCEYEDPVVAPTDEKWDYAFIFGAYRHICPKCVKQRASTLVANQSIVPDRWLGIWNAVWELLDALERDGTNGERDGPQSAAVKKLREAVRYVPKEYP